MRIPTRLATLASIAIVVAACTGSGTSASPAASAAAAPSVAPSEAASAASSGAPSVGPSATDDACNKGTLATLTPGKLTVGTDNPAYPPYFAENKDGHKTDPWELGDPTNGQGFESAVAYAVAKQLGYADTDVTWTVVPFNSSFAPGPKAFDVFIGQVNNSPERAQAADLTDGYYFGNQSLVVLKKSPLAKATKISELKDGVFGAQVGTTSLAAITSVIAPTNEPKVYDTTDAAVEALKQGQIDGIVVDLPTADFITNVQVEGSTIVGQFEGGTPQYFSLVLQKDSALTDCLNNALADLTEAGTLDALASKWLPFQDSVPVFQP